MLGFHPIAQHPLGYAIVSFSSGYVVDNLGESTTVVADPLGSTVVLPVDIGATATAVTPSDLETSVSIVADELGEDVVLQPDDGATATTYIPEDLEDGTTYNPD